MAQLNKAKTFRTDFMFEDSPVTITINPDLTIDLAVLRRPTSKFTFNALAQYLDSKKIGGANSRRKTFALNGKDIVLVSLPKTAPPEPQGELVIEECAPVDDLAAA
jgi:hypothetical protein